MGADEQVTLELPWAPGHTVTGPADHARKWVELVQRQRVARTQWPADNRAQMTALARLFPCFRDQACPSFRVPGIDPWNPDRLVHWLNTSGAPTSGSRHAAMFLLCVWNREDWCDFGLKLRRHKKGEAARRIGRFDLHDAWSNWDEGHRAAALAWLINPFWP